MDNRLVKAYAAFNSGCMGSNILEAYFPFFANIICEEQWDTVDEYLVAEKFSARYNFSVPTTFVRQVLSVGIDKKAIQYSHGVYRACKDILSEYRFDSFEFDKKWRKLQSEFRFFCKKLDIDLSKYDVENRILECLDRDDTTIIEGESYTAPECADTFDYAWSSYVTHIEKTSSADYDFIVSVSLSNVLKQAAFYTEGSAANFKGLNVYLDSPLIFALLGIDLKSRTDSCIQLLDKMKEAGCNVLVFEHNYQEFVGILERAAGWATSVDYDLSKANNASRFFHDNNMTELDIAEYIESIPDRLSHLGIARIAMDYDVHENQFQEDEKKLNEMIEAKYCEQGQEITDDRKRSIQTDVRSMVMVYRARRGQYATIVQAAHEIMLTLNGTIASVAKNYESILSIKAGRIPSCITADLFGTILWLYSPAELMKYQKLQLLADCYTAMKPTKKMKEQFIEALNRARINGEIDDRKFYFMRSHAVVNDALMNVTKGDYAKFNSQTPFAVYEEIKEMARKELRDEQTAHDRTKDVVAILREELEKDQQKIKELSTIAEERQKQLDSNYASELKRRCNRKGWIYTIATFGFPYLLILGLLEYLKSIFTTFTFWTILIIGIMIVAGVPVALFFNKGKEWCFRLAEKQIKSKDKKDEVAVS